MPLQSDLIQKVQNDYIGTKYRDGLFAFPSLDEETIEVVIKAFITWATNNKHVVDGKLNLDLTDNW